MRPLGRMASLVALVMLAALPWVLARHQLSILTDLLIFGLFALSLDLIIGYSGMVSFGHAAYFGLGAYGSALVLIHWGPPVPVALLTGAVLAALIAAPVGWFSTRATGIYFAMLTLAFAQLLYFIAFHAADLTGGDDGLRGIAVPPLRLPGLTVPLDQSLAFYYFTLCLVGVAVAGLKRILDSPFGAVLQAIRENSDRAAACGYDINRLKWLSFVFYSLFVGLAGALDALRLTVVPVESFYWTTSGQVVIMTLLGGAGTFFGPFVGALAFLVLEDRISVFTESWPLVVGAIFIIFVIFLPKGIWGTLIQRIPLPSPAIAPEPAGAPSLARRT
jgi:branched-chain amino acid transport system permease protein